MHKLEVHAREPADDDDDVTSQQHSPVNMQHEPAVGTGTDTAVHALELARLRLSQDRIDQPNGYTESSGELLDETAGQHDETNGIPLPMSNYKRSVRSLSDPVSSRRTNAAAQVQQRHQQQQQQQAAAGGFAVPVQHALSQQLAASAGADVGAALERLLQLHTAQVCRIAKVHSLPLVTLLQACAPCATPSHLLSCTSSGSSVSIAEGASACLTIPASRHGP